MRAVWSLLAVLVVALGFGSAAGAGDVPRVPQLPGGWIEGSWVREEGGRVEIEQWIRVHPRLLVGSAGVRTGDETRWTEHLRIEEVGQLVQYVATPEGHAPTAFRLTLLGAYQAVFENPAHDDPQRIAYQTDPDGDGVLKVRLEAGPGGPPPRDLLFRAAPAGSAAAAAPAPIVKAVTVEAPRAEVFRVFTTRDGVKTFFAPDANVEAREDGPYEIWFLPEAPAGSRGCDGCRIVELVPDKTLAVTWSFPPSLPALRPAYALVTLGFAPAEGGGTTVTLTHTGFRNGAAWDEGRAYFDKAWDVVLGRLKERFEKGPVD